MLLMKSIFTKCLLLASSCLVIAGCSDSEDSSGAAEAEKAAEAQAAQNKELKSTLSKGLADVQKSVDASSDNLKAEMEKQKKAFTAELEKQKSELISQFKSSNGELASQVASLKSQYEKLSSSLPAAISKQLDQKISVAVSSLQKLQGLVKGFDPNSIEQINEFKTKYQKELSLAQDLVSQALKLLEAKNISLPKLP